MSFGSTLPGAGFSATRAKGGVLIVFERGGGGANPGGRTATAGRPLQIRFDASDNDLVSTCTLKIDGHTVGRLLWPASTFRWLVPAGIRGPIRITVVAVDRAGNHASATTKPVPIRP